MSGHDHPDMDGLQGTIHAVIGVCHEQTAMPGQQRLVVGACRGEHRLARRAIQPLENGDPTGYARMTWRPSFGPCGIASLLLFCDEHIRNTAMPLPEAKLMHVAIARTHTVGNPWSGRIGRLLIVSDPAIIPGTARTFVLIVDREHVILCAGPPSRRKSVTDVADADVVLYPIRRTRIATAQTRVLIPVNLSRPVGAYEMWDAIILHMYDRNVIADIRHIVDHLPMQGVVLKRDKGGGPQQNTRGTDDIRFAVAVEILETDVMTAMSRIDDVSRPGPGNSTRVPAIHGILEPNDPVADRGHHIRVLMPGKTDRPRALVGRPLRLNVGALPRPFQRAAHRAVQI